MISISASVEHSGLICLRNVLFSDNSDCPGELRTAQ